MTLNLWELGGLPQPSSGAAWGPQPLSVELSELLLLLGSLATELATDVPLSLASQAEAPGGLSARCAGTRSAHPGVSSPSRAAEEESALPLFVGEEVGVPDATLPCTPAR